MPLSLCPLAVGGAGSGGGGGEGGVAAQRAAHTPASSATSTPALLPAEMSNCTAAARQLQKARVKLRARQFVTHRVRRISRAASAQAQLQRAHVLAGGHAARLHAHHQPAAGNVRLYSTTTDDYVKNQIIMKSISKIDNLICLILDI